MQFKTRAKNEFLSEEIWLDIQKVLIKIIQLFSILFEIILYAEVFGFVNLFKKKSCIDKYYFLKNIVW